MNDKELEELVIAESEWAEAHMDDPYPEGAVFTRPGNGGRPRILSIRISESELEQLDSAAVASGTPASALARTWLLERLQAEATPSDLKTMAETLEALSRQLSAVANKTSAAVIEQSAA